MALAVAWLPPSRRVSSERGGSSRWGTPQAAETGLRGGASWIPAFAGMTEPGAPVPIRFPSSPRRPIGSFGRSRGPAACAAESRSGRLAGPPTRRRALWSASEFFILRAPQAGGPLYPLAPFRRGITISCRPLQGLNTHCHATSCRGFLFRRPATCRQPRDRLSGLCLARSKWLGGSRTIANAARWSIGHERQGRAFGSFRLVAQ